MEHLSLSARKEPVPCGCRCVHILAFRCKSQSVILAAPRNALAARDMSAPQAASSSLAEPSPCDSARYSIANCFAEKIQTCPRPGKLGRVHQNQNSFLRADGILQLNGFFHGDQCSRRPHDSHRRILSPEKHQRLDPRVEVLKPFKIWGQLTHVRILRT